jgi:hypothetical protein
MKVALFDQIPASEWEDLVEKSRDGWLFHRPEWVRIETAFFAAENLSFGVRNDRGLLVAVCPLYLRLLSRGAWRERLLDSGHHRQSGPAFRADMGTSERKAVIKVLMQHILECGVRKDTDRIQLNANNLAPANRGDRTAEVPFWVRDYGFQLGLHVGPNGDLALPGMSAVCADQIIDLTVPEEAVLQRFEANFRSAVRQASKQPLRFDPGTGPSNRDDLAEYYRLAQLSAARTGEVLPAVEYYRALWESFRPARRCAILFARHLDRSAAAMLVLLDKEGALYLTNVSDPEFLPWRVNNFLHWEAMRWLRSQGVVRYRLGPVFPELPEDWPVSQVSWFKGRLGGESFTIVQGSLFRKPERYRAEALEAVERRSAPKPAPTEITVDPGRDLGWRHFAAALAPYGFLPGPGVFGARPGGGPALASITRFVTAGAALVRVSGAGDGAPPQGLDMRAEPGRRLLRRPGRSWFGGNGPAYHALLPHVSLRGPDLLPVWETEDGRAVIAGRDAGGLRELLIGLQVVEELIRHTHGDPTQVGRGDVEKSRWDFPGERPNYLFEDQLVPHLRTIPWADHLGFTLAEALAELTGLPLIEPLPHGARGAVLLTGDDDEAYLEKYAEQLRLVGDFPISYFLLDRTRHTSETIARLPAHVELGLHADALDAPDQYDERCRQQLETVQRLCGRPVRTVRNHGFLNRGYLGHLPVWEATGIRLDVNYPGLDGTALTASFLPFQNRRPDGTWADHYSLVTTFGDGMIGILKLTQRQAAARVRMLCRQIDRSYPGIVCVNFHPQNVASVTKLHQEILAWGRSRAWVAFGAESLLDWWTIRNRVTVEPAPAGATIVVPPGASGLVARVPTPRGWQRSPLPDRAGHHSLVFRGPLKCAS